eukprot:999839-Amphidinium_carterae.2
MVRERYCLSFSRAIIRFLRELRIRQWHPIISAAVPVRAISVGAVVIIPSYSFHNFNSVAAVFSMLVSSDILES